MATTTEVTKDADVSGATPLDQTLKAMSKTELIKYADKSLGLNIDAKLDKSTVLSELLLFDSNRRASARAESELSAKASESDTDPLINVTFYNMQTANEDITFNFAGPKGTFGPINLTGHKKIPKYHLFPGMKIQLPYSVCTHLRSLVFTRHRPVFDEVTGLQAGAEPIVTPRFILEQQLTKEEAIALQKLRK